MLYRCIIVNIKGYTGGRHATSGIQEGVVHSTMIKVRSITFRLARGRLAEFSAWSSEVYIWTSLRSKVVGQDRQGSKRPSCGNHMSTQLFFFDFALRRLGFTTHKHQSSASGNSEATLITYKRHGSLRRRRSLGSAASKLNTQGTATHGLAMEPLPHGFGLTLAALISLAIATP